MVKLCSVFALQKFLVKVLHVYSSAERILQIITSWTFKSQLHLSK